MDQKEEVELKIPDSDDVKKQQIKLWAMGLSVVALIGLGVVFIGGDKKSDLAQNGQNQDPTIYDVTGSIDNKNYWMYKNEGKLAAQEEAQGKILQEIDKLRGEISRPSQAIEENSLDSRDYEIEELRRRLQTYESQPYIAEVKSEYKNEEYHEPVRAQVSHNTLPDQNYYEQSQPMQSVVRPAPGIFSETLALEPISEEESNSPHIDSYIPAGSFAKAVLLSGVDVSAGVSSQANPKPVVLRLTDKGSLPNRAVGNMKECRVVAAAYGDLSSERAYMRLEKLSCIEKDGHIIETDVDGYISGEDGKNGLRGNVVMRDGEVLKRGFVGGLFSGLGKATAQTFQTTSVSPLGVTSSVTGADSFAKATADGVGDAFELMAKYSIQRAEQYQPVIQVSAGREVEIVFHSGSKFGEKKTREVIKKSGDIYAG